MKKSTSRWLSGLVLAGAFMASVATAAAEPIKIAIANFGEHPQLNASIAGFKKALADNGFVEGKDVVYTESNTSFDASLVPQMIAKLQSDHPKLMYTDHHAGLADRQKGACRLRHSDCVLGRDRSGRRQARPLLGRRR